MKKKKSLIAVGALLLVALVGTTIAYYMSSDSFTNIFNTGLYKIVTTEVFESPENWVPGEEIPKTITSTNEGTVPAAVRVSYTEKWEDASGNDITSQVTPNPAIINFDNTTEWIHEGNYYYYKYILEPNDTTSSFISSVTLNSNLNGVTCTGSGNTRTCISNNQASGAKYILTLTKETVQADKYASVWNTQVEITEKPVSSITYLTRQVEGQITPGDVIGIGETEDFYVISSDAEKTVLLAKYNLLIGRKYEAWDYVGDVQPSDTGYGLQSEDAISYSDGSDFSVGFVPFSYTNYWDDGNGNLISPYNQNETNYSSNPLPYVYDENSNIYQYISGENGYVNKLKAMGAPSTTTGRLLSYEEAISNRNVMYNGVSIIENGRTYWLGSTGYDGNPNTICLIFTHGQSIDYLDYTIDSDGGVRAVIEVPTSEIE